MNPGVFELKKSVVTLLMLLFLLDLKGFCQKRELQVGDTLPDIEINNILNYKVKSSKISDFKGRLLIIDFWATWCAPCISSFRKLDSLQKQFGQEIQILPVTYEEGAVVNAFLKRMSKILGVMPVTATNDNTLRSIFGHTSLPHYVWLDQSRTVIAVSQGNDVTKENISSYLKEGKLRYTLKVEDNRKLVKVPAFPASIQIMNGNDTTLEKLNDSNLLIHTVLTDFVEGLTGGGSFRDSTYLSVRNSSIASLYKIALFGNSLTVVNTSTVKVEIEDPTLYMKIFGVGIDGTSLQPGLESLAWQKTNGYSYECKVPPILAKERFNIMKDELNRYFGAKYGIIGLKEKQKRKCLALLRISNEDKLATKGEEPIIEYDKFYFRMRNMDINSFKDRLALPLQSYPPVINETNYLGKIDLELNCNLSDLNSLNNELKKFGLKLEEKELMIDTGVIKMIDLIKRN